MRTRIYKIFCLAALVLVIALMIGCGSGSTATTVCIPYTPPPTHTTTTTVYNPPTTVYVPSTTTTTYSPPPSPSPLRTITVTHAAPSPTPTPTDPYVPGVVVTDLSNYILTNGNVENMKFWFPAGHTMIFTWSADYALDGFLFTETQWQNSFSWKSTSPPTNLAHDRQKNGSLSFYAQNSDTYEAVLFEGGTIDVKIYSAVVKVQ